MNFNDVIFTRRVTFFFFKKMVSTPPSGGWVNYRSQKLRRPSITNFVPHSTGDKFFYSAQTYRFLLRMIRCESFQLCVRQQETTSSSFIQTKFLLTNLVFIAISFRQTICAEIDIFTGCHHPWRSGQGIVFLAVPLAAGRREKKKNSVSILPGLAWIDCNWWPHWLNQRRGTKTLVSLFRPGDILPLTCRFISIFPSHFQLI